MVNWVSILINSSLLGPVMHSELLDKLILFVKLKKCRAEGGRGGGRVYNIHTTCPDEHGHVVLVLVKSGACVSYMFIKKCD